jgi:hypothetical protein
MSIPNIISINNNNYYNAKELYAYDKVYFYGCGRSIRLIIDKKSINNDNYIYASYNKKKGWTVYTDEDKLNNKAKLLLREEWVINNVAKMNTSDEELNEDDMFHDDVFGASSTSFPCVYLLSLGKVKALRNTFNIPEDVNDNYMVYKYGMTQHMSQRIKEHMGDYGKMENVELKLDMFSYVDVKYKAKAEGRIRTLFNQLKIHLDIEGRNELVAIDSVQYSIIQDQYKIIYDKYSGATKELQDELVQLNKKYKEDMLEKENTINTLQLHIEYKNKLNEAEKQCIINDNNNNIKLFDMERKNYELQIQVLQLQNNNN